MPKLFVGLDVADLTTAICILDRSGKSILETTVATTPTAISGALKPFRSSIVNVGQETGLKSAWLHKELCKRKLPMVCLDARHAHAALSVKPIKTDKNDARGLATLLRREMYTMAHVKSDECARIRLLLTVRRSIQRKALDLATCLRMSLKTFGVHIEMKGGRIKFRQGNRPAEEAVANLLSGLLRSSDALEEEVAALDRLVVRTASEDPVCQRLMTIPGIGPITALTYRAAVDDPTRFKSSRTVAAYFGLTSRRFQSGPVDINGRISKHGDRTVRTALFIAARSLLINSRSQWELRLWGLRLAKKKGFNKAAIACARKLAVVMHSVWMSGEVFRTTPTS